MEDHRGRCSGHGLLWPRRTVAVSRGALRLPLLCCLSALSSAEWRWMCRRVLLDCSYGMVDDHRIWPSVGDKHRKPVWLSSYSARYRDEVMRFRSSSNDRGCRGRGLKRNVNDERKEKVYSEGNFRRRIGCMVSLNKRQEIPFLSFMMRSSGTDVPLRPANQGLFACGQTLTG
jgi:hypothetical protein